MNEIVKLALSHPMSSELSEPRLVVVRTTLRFSLTTSLESPLRPAFASEATPMVIANTDVPIIGLLLFSIEISDSRSLRRKEIDY